MNTKGIDFASDKVLASRICRDICCFQYKDLDEEFFMRVTENTRRYVGIFADAIDELMLEPTEAFVDDDDDDILMTQRSDEVVDGSDPHQKMPLEIKRFFEVYIKASSKGRPFTIREVKASNIGQLLRLAGIVTRCSDVKPLMQVAVYTCEDCGFEIYQLRDDLQAFPKMLVVGAGGLGCELLKYLALTGFRNLEGDVKKVVSSAPSKDSPVFVVSVNLLFRTSELVEAVLQGRNGSVFCYGATGAGKTYTMLGTVENPGVMVLAIKDLFSKIRQRSCDGSHVVHLSYLEVYNETVRDLLCPGRPLVLREDKQGIVAAGLTQYRASSADEVMVLLQQGNRNRTTEPTRANETSLWSHAILQVVVEYRVRDVATTNIVNRVGKLSLIDLAGSERALATDQRTLRSLEGANINRSLLALSSCINALVEGKKHIPYRNSKLTQLLKDSIGGICNTVMIANISPSSLSFGETQNTVHWADRAKEIRLKVSETNEDQLQIHETDTDQAKLIHELQKENHEIRMQLAQQQQKLSTLEAQSLASHSSTPPPPYPFHQFL